MCLPAHLPPVPGKLNHLRVLAQRGGLRASSLGLRLEPRLILSLLLLVSRLVAAGLDHVSRPRWLRAIPRHVAGLPAIVAPTALATAATATAASAV